MPLQLEGLKISLVLWGCLTVPTGKILSMDQAALVSSKGNRDAYIILTCKKPDYSSKRERLPSRDWTTPVCVLHVPSKAPR